MRERVPAAHTAVGTFVIEDASTVSVEPSEVDAFNTCVLVFPFMTAASEEVAVRIVAFVLALIAVWLALIAELRDEVAVCTSDNVAREPAERPAPVRVRVP